MKRTKAEKIAIISALVGKHFAEKFPAYAQGHCLDVDNFSTETAASIYSKIAVSRYSGLRRATEDERKQQQKEWELDQKREAIKEQVLQLIKTGEMPTNAGDIYLYIKGLILIVKGVHEQVEALIV